MSAKEVSSVDVKTLTNGLYFVNITIEGKTYTVKIIKK